MRALRVKQLFAASAIGVLMAGGAAIGAAGTASAAVPTHSVSYVTGGGWDDDDDHGGWYDDDDDWGGGYGDDC
ncbi:MULTISPECIES: hypothetical protein [Streptomyces]|uniref:Uncharacterized protein n=1 Tax=Streptomyces katrae TaxID=68223 RepID=A0ABT7GPM8_9ACTN|nr:MULTISPECIES: hypothetical protein [Streptomyces]MDK9495549.1 hypothetical protein [Streptomyces katrae]GLX21679.1 hypothetical protein Slala01_53230 [Streptomyces lavendulae subsp. lavendulae]GLX29096.1 hypothetical protein Slala02_49160 [Streptomyces lavendulae subsp. lavendulae]